MTALMGRGDLEAPRKQRHTARRMLARLVDEYDVTNVSYSTVRDYVAIGDSGTGKTHLLIALGTLAAESGYRVRYTLAAKLVNELVDVLPSSTG